MKLAIGTAQFGSSYGITNLSGKVAQDEASKILELAKLSGIDTLDTAIAYGDSEAMLGSIGVDEFKVITKLPSIPNRVSNIQKWLEYEIEGSLKRLRRESLYGLLMHSSADLVNERGKVLISALERLKQSGLVEKIGVSIYNPAELDCLKEMLDLDLVQCPINVVDRRIIDSGWLRKLLDQGTEVHARSVFLQGLLLSPRSKIPKRFEEWSSIWDHWHNGLRKNEADPLSQCLKSVQGVSGISKIVVGIENVKQIKEIVSGYRTSHRLIDWSSIVSSDERLINPSVWS